MNRYSNFISKRVCLRKIGSFIDFQLSQAKILAQNKKPASDFYLI